PCGLCGKPSEDGLDLSTDVLVFLGPYVLWDDFSILVGRKPFFREKFFCCASFKIEVHMAFFKQLLYRFYGQTP
ncbi:hypothetical protein L9F63_008012, partial [Diploptera punctata]